MPSTRGRKPTDPAGSARIIDHVDIIVHSLDQLQTNNNQIRKNNQTLEQNNQTLRTIITLARQSNVADELASGMNKLRLRKAA